MTLEHPPPAIVVGLDGTATSRPALGWAIDEASTRGLALRLVSTWSSDYGFDSLGLSQQMVIDHCSAVLDEAKAVIESSAPDVPVSALAVVGSPGRVLVEESLTAEMVVVGSRGLRTLEAALLGATSLEVASHAHCPVVVVRGSDPVARPGGPVVVGVDGSPVSADAIGYAFERADRRGLGVHVVHAWHAEYLGGVISGIAAEDSTRTLSDEEHAATMESIAGWRGTYPDVEVETVVLEGSAVDTLAARSEQASLVVLGSHGRGPWGSVLHGSVGNDVLRRAECPVAIVRPRTAQVRR